MYDWNCEIMDYTIYILRVILGLVLYIDIAGSTILLVLYSSCVVVNCTYYDTVL